MNEIEIKILTDRLIPVPRKLRFTDGPDYRLRDRCPVQIEVENTAGIRKQAMAWFKSFWGIIPDLVVRSSKIPGKTGFDAYKIKVSENELAITAVGLSGLRNALKTLRQLAEVERGTKRVSGYFLVQCEISDEPAMEFRGIHLCIFPETPLWDIEKQIRLAAYHKFNYAVIETWGVFPFESHPEFCWADRKIDKKELKRLIRLGKELGIKLVPQFNLLGHATSSRSITGKHAILDFNPALQPLFEPDGWTWCISNPETRSILTDLVTELHEFYDRPPFFHIGCDEADNIGTCRECRRQVLKDLVRDHILFFHDLLRERGTRVLMWHDMLVEQGDPRWKGYTAYGLPHHHFNQLYRELPRDIIIADWQYHLPESEGNREPQWPTARFFHAEKFQVLLCPWLDEPGIISLGKMAAKKKMFGMLETTWHKNHDRPHATIFGTAACSAWNPAKPQPVTIELRLSIAHHLRQIGWDMKIAEYEKTGFSQNQMDPGLYPHQVL